MNETSNRRGRHRRYADRRIAALLQIHEVFFHDLPGPDRSEHLMRVIQEDFETDRAALLVPDVNPEGLRFLCRSGNWGVFKDRTTLSGCGISALLSVHAENHGALTLSRFRQTSQFDSSAWDALWNTDLGEPASALLSVDIADNTDVVLGWLIVALNGTSREWSSHDRDLAEEIALLLAVAMKRAIL